MGEVTSMQKYVIRVNAILSGAVMNGKFLKDIGLMPEIRNSRGEVVFGMDGAYQSRLLQ